MKLSALATYPQQLNTQWAQKIVNQHAKDVRVLQVNINNIDLGTTTRVRLSVDYAKNCSLPRHWFVKLPAATWRARAITALPRLLQTEVRFYQEIAPLIPLNRAISLAGHSHFGKGATLVLQDITEFGAIPGQPLDALTVEQARLVIAQLAKLHSHFWHKANLDPRFQWLNSKIRKLEDFLGSALAVPLMKQGLNKAQDIIPKQLLAPSLTYASKRKQAMQFLTQEAYTLVHHDCHPGNLFWHNHEPGFLDWQMVRIGEGIGDVAYFLATALDPELRREHEQSLLAYYQHCLGDNGPASLSFKQLFERYRAHLVYPFEAMIDTLAIGNMMHLPSNLELIRRTATAIMDLEAFNALPI